MEKEMRKEMKKEGYSISLIKQAERLGKMLPGYELNQMTFARVIWRKQLPEDTVSTMSLWRDGSVEKRHTGTGKGCFHVTDETWNSVEEYKAERIMQDENIHKNYNRRWNRKNCLD